MSGNLTIHDIAQEAGVSASTVSRVLSGFPNVSKKTREKVMRIVKKYDFQPNSLARDLQQQHSRTLGIIMPDADHPYYASLFTAAYHEASERGYSLTLYSLRPDEPLTPDFVNQLITQRLDGVILTGDAVESSAHKDMPQLLNRIMQYMPLVAICPPIPNVPCVYIANDLDKGMRLCVRHLHALGHERIAFAGESLPGDATTPGNSPSGTHPKSSSVSERLLSFLSEMKHLGLSPQAIHTDMHRVQDGEEVVSRLLGSTPRAQWPTALIATNDLMCMGMLKQLSRMNIRVPEDMALIGCDDQFFAAYLIPGLTTLNLNTASHGRMAVSELLGMVGTKQNAYYRLYEPTLVVRESCGSSHNTAYINANPI